MARSSSAWTWAARNSGLARMLFTVCASADDAARIVGATGRPRSFGGTLPMTLPSAPGRSPCTLSVVTPIKAFGSRSEPSGSVPSIVLVCSTGRNAATLGGRTVTSA